MGRLKFARKPPVLCLAAVASLAACANPQQPLAYFASVSQIPAPDGLIGATPGILSAEFGQPILRRIDGTAQVWLYQTASCGLNLFLYPDASGTPRVTMATTAAGSLQIGDCPASLAQSHTDALTNMPADAALERPAAS